MDARRPSRVVAKLQISSANWTEGTGRSWINGPKQPMVNAKTISAIKRLNRSGERGSPCRRPTLVEKEMPNRLTNLRRYEALTYMSSTILQIDKSIGQEDVVRSTVTSSERALKGMSNVFPDHKRHKAIIKSASKQFTQTRFPELNHLFGII